MHFVVGIFLDTPTLRHHGPKFIDISRLRIGGPLCIHFCPSLSLILTATAPLQHTDAR